MSDLDPQSLQSKAPNEASPTEPETAEKQTATREASASGAPAAKSDIPVRPKTKSIFVFCDGTGNEFAIKESLNGNSNVVKLYTALHLTNEQVAYYHPGVGTLGDPNKKGIWKKWAVIKGLAFGFGFRDNVLDAYRYLMQHYAAGDHVYIFGFSRGAYTARALAGVLHGYGLLCRGNEGHLPYAWRMYTERVASQKEVNAHTIKTDTTFRDTFSHPDFTIHFIGLWDTVSSVGWVSSPVRLLDMAENSTIQRGRHAVSIDERRCFYQDNLWGKQGYVDIPLAPHNPVEAANILRKQDQQQVWFSGVHSDVGGSYPQRKSGLSNITLEWMIGEARHAGAVFDEGRTNAVLGKYVPQPPPPAPLPAPENVALADLYEAPNSAMLHESLHGIGWWLLEFLPHRYYDKDDSAARKRIPLGAYRKIPAGALIHPSVKDRLLTDPCYRPENISATELAAGGVFADAAGNKYLSFQPTRCRDHSLRDNWFVTQLAEFVEIAGALLGILRLGQWLHEHRYASRFYNTVRLVWLWMVQHIQSWRFWQYGVIAQFLLLVLLVAVLAIVIKSVRFVASSSE